LSFTSSRRVPAMIFWKVAFKINAGKERKALDCILHEPLERSASLRHGSFQPDPRRAGGRRSVPTDLQKSEMRPTGSAALSTQLPLPGSVYMLRPLFTKHEARYWKTN
ncbi:MAG: hypothetical protein ABJC04_10790, partial [Verrucomicrobiota bacterium]